MTVDGSLGMLPDARNGDGQGGDVRGNGVRSDDVPGHGIPPPEALDAGAPADPGDGAAVTVSALSLDFPIYHGGSRSLKKTVLSLASNRMGRSRDTDAGTGGHLGTDRTHRVVVRALREVSFTLRSGERLGLVGHNGAGKSTLLRALGGIYEPVAGSVEVLGSVGTLLDPNFGMNLDLTGRENIVLRGRYAGLNGTGIRALEADVEAFASLGPFLDLPVRTYSSGMVVRLGFALSTAAAPQVLLMDEWFMAGDAKFQDKAHRRLETVVRGAEILVLTSHTLEILRSWCTRLIWLEHGAIRMDGTPDEVLAAYAGV
ncbi:ABC transporter ATP-binding protein [Rhizosaccharibacter radicis]|uniref:ABC transporter ATP-binding protein n=1 Tax=Rhizosaccharibacter radicis TaxID=2782605 RepID=A0ABT1W0J8_9PROT|nr:ABC transporter ATP-binding protein [Acetobacteraceae bacterium KSS12]